MKMAFVVPTKDRPAELARFLRSLKAQIRMPDEIIVVDGSDDEVRSVVAAPEFSALPLRYLRCRPPSATRQRNVGTAAVSPGIPLIGYLDDDVVLAPGAIEAMAAFWETAPAETGGASFNLTNHPDLFAARWKRTGLAARLGFYSAEPGRVLRSGFQTMIGRVERTVEVQWIGAGAAVWRREVLAGAGFDEWFRGYSYLEDLEFSYRVGRSRRLAVVAGADYVHLPGPRGRGNGYQFGLREAFNRLYFVKKYPDLSPALCAGALAVRVGLSLAMAFKERDAYYLGRAFGALVGIVKGLMLEVP